MKVTEETYIRLSEDEVTMMDFINSSLIDPQTHKVLLNGLIESIATGNDTYTLESFKSDVKEAIQEIKQ